MASTTFLCSALVLMFSSVAFCCSPMDTAFTPQQKIQNAAVVVLAKVLQHYPDPRHSRAYTAELQVSCVLKAPRNLRINTRHNISEAGNVAGKCFQVNLRIDVEYIVLAYAADNVLYPYESPMEATQENIQEVATNACGLSPSIPSGGSGRKCPTEIDRYGCLTGSLDALGHDHDDEDHGHDVHHDGHYIGDSHDHYDHHHDDDNHDHNHENHNHGDLDHDDHEHHHDDDDHHDGDDHHHDDHHHDDGDNDHDHENHDHDHDDDDHDDHHAGKAEGEGFSSASFVKSSIEILLVVLPLVFWGTQ